MAASGHVGSSTLPTPASRHPELETLGRRVSAGLGDQMPGFCPGFYWVRARGGEAWVLAQLLEGSGAGGGHLDSLPKL